MEVQKKYFRSLQGSHQRQLKYKSPISPCPGHNFEKSSEPPNNPGGGPGACSFLFPFHTISPKNGPCRNKYFKTQLECCNYRQVVSDGASVLKELSIYSAAYCYKHLKKLLYPKRKDKFLLLWKLGGFQRCWYASKQSGARIDNHGRNDRTISRHLRTTYATSAHVSQTRCCSLEHIIWACIQCATPTTSCLRWDVAPTRTMSRTAYSYVQSEGR